jgi:hypothetical protein
MFQRPQARYALEALDDVALGDEPQHRLDAVCDVLEFFMFFAKVLNTIVQSHLLSFPRNFPRRTSRPQLQISIPPKLNQ